MTTFYKRFEKSQTRIWNEAVLKKGSKIIGAFHDPSFDPEHMRFMGDCTYKNKEYGKFLEKVKQLDLPLMEVNAKF